MKTVLPYVSFRMSSRAWGGLLPALVLVFSTWAYAEDPEVLTDEQRRAIELAMPAQATVQPAQPRRLLIFSRNVGYGGHRASRAHACEALTLMGRKTGAFETTVSEDPVVFERESLHQYDAVFLNNTIGNAFSDPRLRQNLLEFVTGGGGLMGVHGTSIAFMDWQWPPIEDWPEFGNLIGARGAYHRDDKEQVWVKIDEPDHPLNRAFGGQGFERRDEFFRFHTPYSRQLNRVLLSMDVAKTDLSGFKPDEHLLRQDNDYAVAWIRNYGRGRVFYCSLAHSDSVFRDATVLQFYQDAAQFVLGDLKVPTTPSAKLSPAVLAQEQLGWRLGIEAYTFHKFTFFETIEKTAQLGLPYLGGLSFMQRVSEDTPKNFDQYLTDDELRHVRLKLDSAGVRLLTYYAQDIPDDEAGCRRLFEFGRKMGVETFLCEPKPEQLDLLDKLANEYGINVAIHNHGQNISPHYWNPEGVLKACEGRSKRIGAAPDLGYWLRSGIDPVEAARRLKDRIITVQMHDLHEPGANGHDVPWGKGIGKSEEFFRELHRQGIKPTMIGLEYSHDWFESMPKIAQCIEFFNATTLTLAAETPNPPISATSAETVKDADGNIYHTVKLGNQLWTVENLRTTRFNDGTPIPNVTDDAGWKGLTTPGLCYYENNPEHGKKYGALYNWYAASSDKIAPRGWRVPTHEEQMALRDYLIAHGYNYDGTTEGNKVAKSMAAKTDWIYRPRNEGNDPVPDLGTVGKSPETNNRSGFSALPTGSRWNDGSFHALGTSVYWWSTTPDSTPEKAHMSSVHTGFPHYGNNQHHKRSGFCVRLIRDEANDGGDATSLRTATATRPASFGNPDKIDVLVVTSGHHFDRESFFGIFRGSDDLTYSEYALKDESEVFEDVSEWKYDVIMLYHMTQTISPKRQENFVRLLKEKGVGVVVVHHAQAAFQSWREYHHIIGTAYIYFDVEIDGKPWPHGRVHEGLTIPVSVRDDQHPITRGLKDFKITDETYKGRWWATDNHVLLTTSHPENDEPIAWTRQYGRSRVFNIQLGHDAAAYACPEYRDLLVRGLRWVAENPSAAGKPRAELRQTSGSIDVLVDGKPFTSYVFQIDPAKPLAADKILLTKPVLHPLRTPSGVTVTRGWPFEKVEGESPDHPHHMGLYFTYDLPGNKFWNNSTEPLPIIRHIQAQTTNDPQGNPAINSVMHWIGKDNDTLLVEKRLTSFIAGRDQHLIDFDIELQAVADKVEFGVTKEGMFAVRLAQWLTEGSGTGAYLSSNGGEKEQGVWGKRAQWVRIQGEHQGATAGIAILNHPTSVNYPTYWHARGYGCFSANPLGQYAFDQSRKVENPQLFNLMLQQGETASFKFRVILYDGSRTKEQLDNAFRQYTL